MYDFEHIFVFILDSFGSATKAVAFENEYVLKAFFKWAQAGEVHILHEVY